MLSRSPTVAFADTGSVRLVRRHRFAGERGLLGAQILHLGEAEVGRHLVARFEQHDVARHEFLRGYHARLAAAHGPRLGGQHVADRVQRLLRPAFLDEPEQPVDDDDAEDDRGVDPQAQHQLGEAGGEQDVDQDIVELGKEPQERAPLLALRQAVWPVFFEAGRGFGWVEAFSAVGGEPLDRLLGVYRVPGRDFIRRCGVRHCAHGYSPSSRLSPGLCRINRTQARADRSPTLCSSHRCRKKRYEPGDRRPSTELRFWP